MNRYELRWLRSALMACMMLCAGGMLCACSENDGETDEYANWQSRNETWFQKTMLAAADSISAAKAKYGDAWESYSNRRQYLCYSRQDNAAHASTDSVAVEILKRGEGTRSPYTTDSVRIAYRTLLIPTDEHPSGLVADHSGFSSAYDRVFDNATMAPSTFLVSALVRGVATALLYMHEGDRWRVTMPASLAYGKKASGSIPAYSTVIFEMELVGIYRAGTSPGTWQ